MDKNSEQFFGDFVNILSKFFKELHDTCEKYKQGPAKAKPQPKPEEKSSESSDTEEESKPLQKPTKKVRAKAVDPLKIAKGAPKKPIIQGYLLYFTEVRQNRQESNKDLKTKDITRLIGQEWKNMPAEKRKYYEDRAKQAKEGYLKELEDYLNKHPEVRKQMEEAKEAKAKEKKEKVNKNKKEKALADSDGSSASEDDDDDDKDSSSESGKKPAAKKVESDSDSDSDSDSSEDEPQPQKKTKK